eukprot:3736513-Karenia_brevis.AAC.1
MELVRVGVKDWVEEVAKTEGYEAANNQVADAVAKDALAREVVERAKRLHKESVEMKIPDELLEEAAKQMSEEI